MGTRKDSSRRWFSPAARSWVEAPDVFEEEGLLLRLRANNDALDSLREALDAEVHAFAAFPDLDAPESGAA